MTSLRMHVFAAATALLSLPALAQVSDYHDIKTPPLHQIQLPQPKRVQLANGMVIFLMEDHELPLIQGRARIRGGSRDVAAEKTGLAGILGGAWRTGGTQSKTGDDLDDFLEARAARVETGVGDDSSNVSMSVLKGDFDTVFPIFVDVLEHPAFRQDKVDLAKTQTTTGISRRNDDPKGIADREMSKLGYGSDSPYARVTEYSTVNGITRDDLVAFHSKYVHPNNIILSFVGDFDAAAMEQKIRAAFGSWPKGPQAPIAAPTGGTPAKAGVYYVAKDDVTQSNIYVVHGGTGVQRNNPDFYATQVMNEILSGGFSGRLMNDIRTQRGLAYGVGGGVDTNFDRPGLFHIWMGTKSGSTVEAVNALRTDLSDLQSKPFTADELAQAKDAILNAYVFTADSKAKILAQRVNLEFYGYPADYYQQYPARLQAVTADDVARVAKKYVSPNQVSVLVVGKEKDFDKPLSSLGTVTPIDITIPEPGAKPAAMGGAAAAPSKPASSSPEGIALIKKIQTFVGGKAKIDAVQTTHTVGSMQVQTPQGPMDIEADTITKYPDYSRRIMKTPMGEMTMVSTPEGAFMSSPMGSQDLPGSQRTAMRNESRADIIAILKNIDNPKYTFTTAGTEKVGTVDAQVLTVDADGTAVKWLVDPTSGKILRRVAQSPRGESITDYTDWKSFDGITLPVAFTNTTAGQQSGSGKLTTMEINPTVDPKIFEKPAPK
ncbi:MAG: insulinase family protein [Acidobacteria bacterium]|nr:insulinase family protein [Acidobacteriota bacterium]MBV9067606.1 insulinase family protein [Acidobacteriota bacterium]MBV9185743.1 insulinase family protein [Acidobacteriota bacterium]